MARHVCICRSCVDSRENGLYVQHDLPLYNGIYMDRPKGAFISRPNGTHEVSNTVVMLIELGSDPILVLQGHRDCAAIKVLFNSFGKRADELNNTEREFRRSHGEALSVVKAMADDLEPALQLALLEKACIPQSINNLFSFSEISDRIGKDNGVSVYAYYSLTPDLAPDEVPDAKAIELAIFDPTEDRFVQLDGDGVNEGIRIPDLIDLKTRLPRQNDRFKVTGPIDLKTFVYHQIQTMKAERPYALRHTMRDFPSPFVSERSLEVA